MKPLLSLSVVWSLLASWTLGFAEEPRTNFVFVVADDMGWRDTSYQGSPHAKTPHLDAMASNGVRFDYFYPAQQMCSPGRFAIMTGRNPCRTGLPALGAMRVQEKTIPMALKPLGYGTGHFGKWHLGGKETRPDKMGFDLAIWKINYFDLGATLERSDGQPAVKLEGDTSVATMKLAQEFIRKQVEAKKPFFVQVCFGSPHAPHQATDEFKAIYKDLPKGQQDFYGEISGVDAAVGNLRAELQKLGVAGNTLVWFVSDNGGITPNSQDPAGKGKMNVGVRTVSTLEWPDRIKQPIRTTVPCMHQDMYPTVLEITGAKVAHQPPLDGISLLSLFQGKMQDRPRPMGFMHYQGGMKGNFDKADFTTDTQGVWIDGRYKLIVASKGKGVELYDIVADQPHKKNLAAAMPEVVEKMRKDLDAWRTSVRASYDGKDYAKKNE
jgi:arylsulfatase A-like enzyme